MAVAVIPPIARGRGILSKKPFMPETIVSPVVFVFTMDYHEFIEEKRQREIEAHNEFISAYRLMLMDFGWL